MTLPDLVPQHQAEGNACIEVDKPRTRLTQPRVIRNSGQRTVQNVGKVGSGLSDFPDIDVILLIAQ